MRTIVLALSLLVFPYTAQSQNIDLFSGVRNTNGFSIGIQVPNSNTNTSDINRAKINYLVGVRFNGKKNSFFSVGFGYHKSQGTKERTVEVAPIYPYSINFEKAVGSSNHFNFMLDYMKYFNVEKLRISYGVELFTSLNNDDQYSAENRSSTDSINFILTSGNDYFRRFPNIWTIRPSFKIGAYYPIFKDKIHVGIEVLPGISWQFVRGTMTEKRTSYDYTNNTKLESNRERYDKSNQYFLGLLGQATIQIKLFNK